MKQQGKKVSLSELEYFKELYAQNLSPAKIAKKVNRNGATVYLALRQAGVKMRGIGCVNHRYPNMDHNFFDTIDTEAKAYYLGLLFADGMVSSNRNTIRLKLLATDKYILSSFSYLIYGEDNINFVKGKIYDKKIKSASDNYRIDINSKHMKQALISLGCTAKKSLTLTLPDISSDLLKHFIRGYFDGDGSISSTKARARKGKKSQTINGNDYVWTITTTKSMCEDISKIIQKTIGINTVVRSAKVSSSNYITKTLHSGGNRKILAIMAWLYSDATYFLKRKHDKFLELKAQCDRIDAKTHRNTKV